MRLESLENDLDVDLFYIHSLRSGSGVAILSRLGLFLFNFSESLLLETFEIDVVPEEFAMIYSYLG